MRSEGKQWVITGLLVGVVLLGGVLLLGGCTRVGVVNAQPEEKVEKAVQIGLAVDSFMIERWQREKDVFVAKAKELGAEVNVQNANADIAEQIAQIEYLIQKKVDVIVAIPIDADALSEVIKKARREGIKVIAYDRMIRNAAVDLYISFDNAKVGELMAKAIMERTGPTSKLLMVAGPENDNNVALVNEQFEQTIGYSSRSILEKQHMEEWLPEKALVPAQDMLSRYPTVDAIMCGNDGAAGQVIQLLAERRLAGQVCVVGQDADLDACQRIVEGTQTMTVYKPVAELATRAAEYAFALATTGELGECGLMWDGTYDVPYIGLTPVAVTKENMDEVIIESGFHLKEDVYLYGLD